MYSHSKNHEVHMLLVLGAAVFANGCDAGADATEGPVFDCPAGAVCGVTQTPFVHSVFSTTSDIPNPFTDPRAGETSQVTAPEPGMFCATGSVNYGYAFLALSFVQGDERTPFASGLDAYALGITQIRFDVDRVPLSHLAVQLTSVTPGCLPEEESCMQHSFYLHESDAPAGVESPVVSITQPTQVTAPIADFELAPFVTEDWALNTSALATLNVGIGAFGGVTEDYDFCISHVTFLDESGSEVPPAE